jgi:hypothetical protein
MIGYDVMINLFAVVAKNGKRYFRRTESSAIRFLKIAEAFNRMAASHVHTRLPVCIPKTNCRSANPRSAREPLSRFSRSCERGAVRFLFWWLFLHLRLRSENDGSACAEPFAPSGGSVQRVPLVFIRVAQEDLSAFPSKAFRLRLRASLELTDRC